MRRRRRRSWPFLLLLGLALTVIFALTAANSVPPTRAGVDSRSISADDLKPVACAAITLTNVVTGSGTFNGTNSADLVLGSAGVDTIRGRNGDDCILGGAGNDSLRGDGGTDVCIGDPGTDTFHATCEIQIQ